MIAGLSFDTETNVNGALNMACQKAIPFARAARSDGTLRVYASAWQAWFDWCSLMRTDALPAIPEAVAAYLASLARDGKSVSAVNVALSAILFRHRCVDVTLSRKHPAIANVMAGITRKQARPLRQAKPLSLDDLRHVISSIKGDDIRALRDTALLLIGFFGALRRSEIAALDVTGRSAIEITVAGMKLHLTATKTSLTTETIALPRRTDGLCPVAALERYLAAASIREGALFRAVSKSARLLDRRLDVTSIRHIFRERLGAAFGTLYADDLSRRLACMSPHSLRAGFITAAAKAGAPEHIIQRTSRHKSVDVLRSYIRNADAFAANAGTYF